MYRTALESCLGPAPPALPPFPPAPTPPCTDVEGVLDLVQELLACLHALMLAVLRMRMRRDQVNSVLFRARGLLQGLRQYPYQQLAPCLARPWASRT